MTHATPLAERTAIVTGASSGIGRAIAEQLGGAGAHVFLCGRTAAPMEESQKQIREVSPDALSRSKEDRNFSAPPVRSTCRSSPNEGVLDGPTSAPSSLIPDCLPHTPD
ncbi:MAG TPA: SDR family NAD(P)-dependent oxidoreductase [Deltaproteobacteria bacterium]|nr:SDR family NAD(P)-dependent oxidoreductase [Deltaproteobacteria bacterium]